MISKVFSLIVIPMGCSGKVLRASNNLMAGKQIFPFPSPVVTGSELH